MRRPLALTRPKQRSALARRQAPAGRGVALLFVLTTVAILSVVATDFAYNSRVNLELAVNSRDSLRAHSLAMSGMNFARLVVRFQRQLDQASGALGPAAGALLNGLPGGMDPTALLAMASQAGVNPTQIQSLLSGGLPTGPAAGGGPSIRLWEVLPVDSNAIMGFIASAFPDPESDSGRRAADRYASAKRDHGLEEQGVPVDASFGEFSGSFGAEISDEDQKVNVQRLGWALGPSQLATAIDVQALMADQKYDFLFEEDAANGERIRREDLMLAIKDYLDEDETNSMLDLSGQNANLSPFVNGFGDENGPYSRYKRRYKAKNHKLDSVAELHMVSGMSDAMMAAFGDRFTVFPNVNDRINVNTTDPRQMLVNIILAARNKNDPLLRDPLRLQLIMQQIQLIKRFPFIGLTVQQFASVLQANGIDVDPTVSQNNAQNQALGDRSATFRIVATGQAGRVRKTLTAIVRYDDGLGQLLYWNEQ
jgi:general secretion pathway protein K